MYCNFFGLKTDPFSPISLADCDFPNACFQLGEQRLNQQVTEHTGVSLLVGPTGVGKSWLIGRVSDNIVSQHPNIWLRDLTSFGQFSVTAPNHAAKALELESRARTPSHETNQDKTVFLLDHADSVNDNFLAKILSVVSQRNAAKKPTLLILIGLPKLVSRLEQPRFCSYKSEIRETLQLNRLDQSEIKDYIIHRLRSVECSRELLFTDQAIRSIAEYSGGIPRRINKLCGSSLLLASLEEIPLISDDVIQKATKFCFLDKSASGSLLSLKSNAPSRATEMEGIVNEQSVESGGETLEEIVQMLNDSACNDKSVGFGGDLVKPEPQTPDIPPTKLSPAMASALTDEIRPVLRSVSDFDLVMRDYSTPGAKLVNYLFDFGLVTVVVLLLGNGLKWVATPEYSEGSEQAVNSAELSKSTDTAKVNASTKTLPAELDISQAKQPVNKTHQPSLEQTDFAGFSSIAGNGLIRKDATKSDTEKLLSKAKIQFARNRLSIPKSDNAFETYQQVLAIEPSNKEAIRGVELIQRIFADKAKRAIARKSWRKADKALETAVRLNPEDSGLAASLVDVRKHL